jgi:hypothetical protein
VTKVSHEELLIKLITTVTTITVLLDVSCNTVEIIKSIPIHDPMAYIPENNVIKVSHEEQ